MGLHELAQACISLLGTSCLCGCFVVSPQLQAQSCSLQKPINCFKAKQSILISAVKLAMATRVDTSIHPAEAVNQDNSNSDSDDSGSSCDIDISDDITEDAP